MHNKKRLDLIGQKCCVCFFTGLQLVSSIQSLQRFFFTRLSWTRFQFAAAAQVWLGKDDNIRIVMFVSILIGMVIMCAILTAEIFFDGPKTA